MKIKATLFIVACLLCIRYDALGQWKQVQMFPYNGNQPTDDCESMVINDTAYVASGNSINFEQYDPTTNSWIAKANVGGGRKWGGISFAINGKGYAGAGDSIAGNGAVVADFWQYDPATNIWIKEADFGGGPRDGVVSYAINDTGYVAGGYDDVNILSDFWKYDISKNQWTKIGTLPTGPVVLAAGFVLNNKAYLTTGTQGNISSTGYKDAEVLQLWEYDPATGNWSRKADFPGAGRNSAVGFSVNGKGYIVGGEDSYTQTFTDGWSYDPSQDKWTQIAHYPKPYSAWMNAFVLGNTAYVGAGVGFNSVGLVGENGYYSYDFTPASVTQPIQPDMQLQAYPNPVNGLLTVQAGNNASVMRTELFDVLGNKMDCPVTLSGNTAIVNTQNLHPGVYFLHTYDSHGSVVKKIDVMERWTQLWHCHSRERGNPNCAKE